MNCGERLTLSGQFITQRICVITQQGVYFKKSFLSPRQIDFMPRNPDIPKANHQYLRCRNDRSKSAELIKVGSKRWFEWLTKENTRSFAFEGFQGHFTARKENKQRGSEYWYAYRWQNGKTTKAYLGTSDKLTKSRLNEIAVRLSMQKRSLSLAGGS